MSIVWNNPVSDQQRSKKCFLAHLEAFYEYTRQKQTHPRNAGKTLCIASVMLRWMATFVDHLLLSLIAFSRFILLKSPSLGKMLFDGRAAKVPLLIVWLLGVTAVLPNAFGVRIMNIVLGSDDR